MYLEQHMTANDIAAALGFSSASINNRLAEFGIRLNGRRNCLGVPLEEVRQLYSVEGRPMGEIADSFGCSRKVIRRIVAKAGLIKPGSDEAKPDHRITLGEDELRELYLVRGQSDMRIAREHGVCNLTVANWRRKYGIRRDHQPNYIDLSSDELKRLYVDEKWTMERMAEHFGCGESTVRAHIIRDGLAIDAPEVAKRRLEVNSTRYSRSFIGSGYRRVMLPSHPAANRDGYVDEHRYVAETGIGRYLLPREQVHHISMQKLDNRIENLAVLANKEDHAKLHKYLERIGVYLSGLSTVRPEPLVFSTQTYWGGQYVTGIDLTSNLSLLSAPRSTGQEGVAVSNGEGTDSPIVN